MSSHRFIKFPCTAKLRKSLVAKFSRKCDQPNAESGEAQEVQKVERLCKKSVKLRRQKSRKYVITTLSGCGCQSRRVVVIDRIQAESQLPEVCSLQSLPSCSSSSSLESKVAEWISSSSFDEMLKFLSSSRDHQEVHYDCKSSVEKNSLELHISPVKFSDLVSKIKRSEQTSTNETVDQKNEGNFQLARQGSPKSSWPHMTLRQNVSGSQTIFSGKIVRSNAGKSLISQRNDRMKESLLIMKSSCDPQREFKISMMEMIVENKIKNGKDMEELLACYLYLNSEEYHHVIIQVFKQIWVELFQV